MNPRISILIFSVAAFITGCTATGSHVVTGQPRPAVSPETVLVYHTAPERYEVIGEVTAHIEATGKKATDQCVAELKNQAGKIGANGILIGGQTVSQSAEVAYPTAQTPAGFLMPMPITTTNIITQVNGLAILTR